jgi:hypothetical protein
VGASGLRPSLGGKCPSLSNTRFCNRRWHQQEAASIVVYNKEMHEGCKVLCLLLSLFASLFFVVIFRVVFEVSLLVEVRLRASFSAPKRTPVANDAPALFSASSCFSFDNNQTPQQ